MLVNFILNIVYSVINGFIGLFPTASLNDDIINSINTASGYLSGLNIVLPITTILSIVGLFLTIETILITIKIINWFIRKIPTIN